jgi:ABC-2 type transport system ATP-binding protein
MRPGAHVARVDPSPLPVEVLGVTRAFKGKEVLRDVTLTVGRGEIRALVGPNGAGKTTLLRILTGLTDPDGGRVRLMGEEAPDLIDRRSRRIFGLIPSSDRSFYQRLSGFENLFFFARLHGLSKKDARRRALVCLEDVGLKDAAHVRVGVYSHGMTKRLSVARALLSDPPILLVDEATHDLDPGGSRQVRALVGAAARRGTAILWTTQRLEEIRGFADGVTVLDQGRVRFDGSVDELLSMALPRRYALQLRNGHHDPEALHDTVGAALAGIAGVEAKRPAGSGTFVISLAEDLDLGKALASLASRGIQILGCREETSGVEEAFMCLTSGEAR